MTLSDELFLIVIEITTSSAESLNFKSKLCLVTSYGYMMYTYYVYFNENTKRKAEF